MTVEERGCPEEIVLAAYYNIVPLKGRKVTNFDRENYIEGITKKCFNQYISEKNVQFIFKKR